MINKLELFKKNIMNKEIAVIGIGISNIPLIKLLVSYGAKVCAFDKKNPDQLGKVYNDLSKLGINFSLGDDYLKELNHDIIFKTPGMRIDNPYLLEAKKNKSIITSEMEVFFDLCPCNIIGVTGSDGKTTTTTLIYKMLNKAGFNCWLGGNIGKPLLSQIEKIEKNDYAIVELSSFQLHTFRSSPFISVVTNITPNHLDMHKSMEEYIEAKKNIFIHQSNNSRLVLNYDNKITKNFYNEAKGEKIFFSRKNKLDRGIYIEDNFIMLKNDDELIEILNINDIALLGVHNIENYMAAIGAIYELVHIDTIRSVAKEFKGVEHRIEFVREINGIKIYNDSIASSPTRTAAGLDSFNSKVILIAGGYDKKISFENLGEAINKKVKKLLLIGATAKKIEAAVKNASNFDSSIKIIYCKSIKEAVYDAYNGAEEGDIITLSPACASFDMFKNFEERGNTFKDLVKGL